MTKKVSYQDIVELLKQEEASRHALTTGNRVAFACRAANELKLLLLFFKWANPDHFLFIFVFSTYKA